MPQQDGLHPEAINKEKKKKKKKKKKTRRSESVFASHSLDQRQLFEVDDSRGAKRPWKRSNGPLTAFFFFFSD